MSKTEVVLCVDSREFRASDSLITDAVNLAAARPWFIRRDHCETDPNFRQIIPYICFEFNGRFAYYRRGQSCGEQRLREKLAIGFGGHVGLRDAVTVGDDFDMTATLDAAVLRELSEEVIFAPILSRRLIGYIVSNADDVERVHLGVAHVYSLSEDFVASCEEALKDVNWATPQEILSRGGEGWTEMVCKWLVENWREGT